MKLLFDVTTTARSVYDPPVGTTRVERTILTDLYRALGPENLTFANYDDGRFVHVSPAENAALLSLIANPAQQAERPATLSQPAGSKAGQPLPLPKLVRRLGRAVIGLYPEPFRAQALAAVVNIYLGTRGLLGASWRTVKFALRGRRRSATAAQGLPGSPPPHYPRLSRGEPQAFDFSGHTDLIMIGNGWDYLNYDNIYDLKKKNNLKIHGFVHDLIVVNHPYYFHNPAAASIIHQHYAEFCHLCETLICNSYATREAVLAFIRHESLPSPRIVVAQLPVFASATLAPTRPPAFDEGPFILFVSTIEVRKNHRMLLNVWRECLAEGRAMPRLVLVGRVGWGVDTVMEMIARDPMLHGRVKILHDVEDGQLAWLYDNCLFTVYPSVIEGWGLPIGEALGRGRICLHTTDAAQREAAQGLMPALHPEDFYGWKNAILDLIDRPERRKRLEDTVREKFRPISREDFCASVRAAIGL